MRTVTPYIHAGDPGALKTFIRTAFGADVLQLVNIGSPTVSGLTLGAALHCFVDDVEAAYEQALAAGARVLMGKGGEPANRAYGEHSAFVEDPWGNQWFLAKSLGRGGAQTGELMPYLYSEDARKLAAFLENAFGARAIDVYEQNGRITHTSASFGDSIVEFGEGPAHFRQALHLQVDDSAAMLERAILAGGTELRGEHAPGVKDPCGNHWYLV